MNAFSALQDATLQALRELQDSGELPQGLDLSKVAVEPPRDPSHGDAATNAAMVLAKQAKKPPLAIAEPLAAKLTERPEVVEAAAVKPGFVNLKLEPAFWQAQVRSILAAGRGYGRSRVGEGVKINVEFCSANPTGPLHVGHARGTVFGDALAGLLEFAGYEVTREYYVNDGGAQIEALARSVHHRYLESLGRDVGPVPQGLYPLQELIPPARALAKRDGDRWADAPEAGWLGVFGDFALGAMLERIKDDLAAAGVAFDRFTHERALIEAGKIEATLERLETAGLVYTGTLEPPKGKPVEDYEPTPQLLFRSSNFGDDTDRPLKRSAGQWTYFAADLAYHHDKLERGYDQLVDVFGADHGGYVKRMQAGVKALTNGRVPLDVRLCQLVQLMDGGQPLKMSKRAGRIVTMRDVVDEVGRDVLRFIMLTRKNDAGLEFDLQKAVEQSRDNPVFYVQYAHARACSVFRNLSADGHGALAEDLGGADLSLLVDPAELNLVKQAALFPRAVEAAALNREPHRIAFYLQDLATAFHALWTRGKEDSSLRFILPDQPELTRARLALVEAARTVVAAGLGVIGVRPVEELT